jgi:hypothetical protein
MMAMTRMMATAMPTTAPVERL